MITLGNVVVSAAPCGVRPVASGASELSDSCVGMFLGEDGDGGKSGVGCGTVGDPKSCLNKSRSKKSGWCIGLLVSDFRLCLASENRLIRRRPTGMKILTDFEQCADQMGCFVHPRLGKIGAYRYGGNTSHMVHFGDKER